MLSCLVMSGLFATLWTVTHQAPVSMGFSRKEYWSGLAFPSPGDLPPLGIKPMSPASPALQVVLYLLGERVTLVNKTLSLFHSSLSLYIKKCLGKPQKAGYFPTFKITLLLDSHTIALTLFL